MVGTALSWFRVDTRILTDPEFITLPFDHRGVWISLLALAAEHDGEVKGTPRAIASVIGPERGMNGDLAPVVAAIERLVEYGWLVATDKGFRFRNFDEYNPPKRFLKPSSRGRDDDHEVVTRTDVPDVRTDETDVRATAGPNSGPMPQGPMPEPKPEGKGSVTSALAELERVPQWRKNDADPFMLADILVRHPGLDIVALARRFRLWAEEHPKAKMNRSRFDAWADEEARRNPSRAAGELPIPPVKVQLDRVRNGQDPLTGKKR